MPNINTIAGQRRVVEILAQTVATAELTAQISTNEEFASQSKMDDKDAVVKEITKTLDKVSNPSEPQNAYQLIKLLARYVIDYSSIDLALAKQQVIMLLIELNQAELFSPIVESLVLNITDFIEASPIFDLNSILKQHYTDIVVAIKLSELLTEAITDHVNKAALYGGPIQLGIIATTKSFLPYIKPEFLAIELEDHDDDSKKITVRDIFEKDPDLADAEHTIEIDILHSQIAQWRKSPNAELTEALNCKVFGLLKELTDSFLFDELDPIFLIQFFTHYSKAREYLQKSSEPLKCSVISKLISALKYDALSAVDLMQADALINEFLIKNKAMGAILKISFLQEYIFSVLLLLSSQNHLSKANFSGVLLSIVKRIIFIVKQLESVNFLAVSGQNMLHYICVAALQGAEIKTLIDILLDKKIDFNLKPEERKSPLEFALGNKNEQPLQALVAHPNVPVDQIENLLLAELDNNRLNNACKLIKALMKRAGWNNFALIIDDKSLWDHPAFFDISFYIKVVDAMLTECKCELAEFLDSLKAKKVNCTAHIACVFINYPALLKNDALHIEKIAAYLAGDRMLCEELCQTYNVRIFAAVLHLGDRGVGEYYLNHTCFAEEAGVFKIALDNNNVHFFLIMLRFINPPSRYLTVSKIDKIRNCIIYLQKQGLNIGPIESYLREQSGVFTTTFNKILREIQETRIAMQQHKPRLTLPSA